MDEVERLIQLFASRADAPPLTRMDILLDLRRHHDPRIVPFLLQVLMDASGSSQVRVYIVKQLTRAPLAADENSAVAHTIAHVFVDDDDGALRLEAATALGCFVDIDGIAAALASVAFDTAESLDLRFCAFASLECASVTDESVSAVRKLASDETLGRAARALLASWRIEP